MVAQMAATNTAVDSVPSQAATVSDCPSVLAQGVTGRQSPVKMAANRLQRWHLSTASKPKGHYQARNESTLVTGDIGEEGFLAVRIKDEDGEQCGADHKAGDAKRPMRISCFSLA